MPIFNGDTITVQIMRANIISIGAAITAHVEAAYGSDAEKNALCVPIPAPMHDTDWPRGLLADLHTGKRWAADKALRRWIGEHRLSSFGSKSPDHPEAEAIARRISEARPRAEENLTRIVAALGERTAPRTLAD